MILLLIANILFCIALTVLVGTFFYYGVRYVPYVPSNRSVIKKMIAAADLKDGQKIIDLGCGDARLLIEAMKEKNVQASGVEISFPVYWLAKFRLWMCGMKANITRENFFKVSLKDSDVVFCYLFPKVMEQLKEKFEKELKNGAIVVSHSFPIKEWKPERTVQTRADKPHNFLIYVYRMPCQKA